ncbi:HNH endonuclease [Gordonia phage Rabbitrun]|uniref:HNH endonuclease n=1 Tax=Gordonia phage Rabbitrun TaxID=2762280 RepID=A0A7G8LIT8_9CAUD|nr:HNH endonuclease [Gordonia phage Rabbitrun]QNJ57160.1 HNH endonuclease [Gordonia phage Rabbitrun]
MGKYKGRSGRPYRTARARFRRECERDKAPCVHCGNDIDYSLTGKQDWAWSLDHIIPVSVLKAEDPNHRLLEARSNFQAAHFICNLRRQAGGYKEKATGPAPNASSGDWL